MRNKRISADRTDRRLRTLRGEETSPPPPPPGEKEKLCAFVRPAVQDSPTHPGRTYAYLLRNDQARLSQVDSVAVKPLVNGAVKLSKKKKYKDNDMESTRLHPRRAERIDDP